VIPTIVSELLRGPVVHLGATSPTRDLTFVSDTVAGLIGGAMEDRAVGRTINLGTGNEIAIGRLAEMVAEIVGRELVIEPDSQRLRPESSEVSRLLSDNSLAAELLDWRPGIELDEGLRQTVDWFRQRLTDFRLGQYIT
jgi:dTDP-glucose 4,6-dehydratase